MIKNFRDVGVEVNRLVGKAWMTEGRLLRSGRLNKVLSAGEVGAPGTIVNLRPQKDPAHVLFGARAVQIKWPKKEDRYAVGLKTIRRCVIRGVAVLQEPDTRWPVLYHCTSGKDRTGVVIATVLLAIGVPEAVILQEYLLSEGKTHPRKLRDALKEMGLQINYLRSVDVAVVRRRLLASRSGRG